MKILLGILLVIGINLYADMKTTKDAMVQYKQGNIHKAVKLLGKSCNDKEMNACVYLGYIYAKGLSVKQDYSKGIKLLKKACDNNNTKGCIYLGNAMIEKEVNRWYEVENTKHIVAKDTAIHILKLNAGTKYLEKACDNNSSVGCSTLGRTYWNYIQKNGGVKKFPQLTDKAFIALDKACDLKDIQTCMNLGYTYENLGKKYFPQASKVYKKACDSGLDKACVQYKKLLLH